ncbi:MAG: hypothetical protein V8S74_06340 [Lachnospirales bacterium]
MVKKMGRPTQDPKKNQTRIRMTDEEVAKLNYCSEKLNVSKTDVVNMGIDKVYKELTEK